VLCLLLANALCPCPRAVPRWPRWWS